MASVRVRVRVKKLSTEVGAVVREDSSFAFS